MDQQSKTLALEAIKKIAEALDTLKYLLGNEPKKDVRTRKKEDTKQRYATATAVALPLLGGAPDVNDGEWPIAVPKHMIISPSDQKVKQYRAAQIISIINTPIANIKVLDLGCGDGSVSKEMAKSAAKVIGYDIKKSEYWADGDNLTFTDQIDVVNANGPYDLILLYDVVDHLENTGPDLLFQWVNSLLSDNGKGFARFHPWTSKHGSHLYEKINKAYLHLALTPDELAQAGYVAEHNLKITRPMATYDSFFENNGLSIVQRKGHSDKIDEYVSEHLIERICKVTWRGNIDKDMAKKIMALQFIDYTFSKKSS